jgi:hypothetical protein
VPRPDSPPSRCFLAAAPGWVDKPQSSNATNHPSRNFFQFFCSKFCFFFPFVVNLAGPSFAPGPHDPRLSPQNKITVELKFRHAKTLCSSRIEHLARLQSPANPRRRGIRPHHFDTRRGTTPSSAGEPNDFESIRHRWIIQKSGF